MSRSLLSLQGESRAPSRGSAKVSRSQDGKGRGCPREQRPGRESPFGSSDSDFMDFHNILVVEIKRVDIRWREVGGVTCPQSGSAAGSGALVSSGNCSRQEVALNTLGVVCSGLGRLGEPLTFQPT